MFYTDGSNADVEVGPQLEIHKSLRRTPSVFQEEVNAIDLCTVAKLERRFTNIKCRLSPQRHRTKMLD